jgi:hypothetical protein
MARFNFDEDDLEYELQYADDDSYRNSKKKKRGNRQHGRNLKTAWLDNQGDDPQQVGR